MSNFNVQAAIKAANARLKAAQTGCTIQLRGENRLWIRGTFPDKKGIRKPYQQRIALKQYATVQTVKDAEELCKLIGIELNRGTFDWRRFSDGDSGDTVGAWVERFAADRWSKREQNHQSLSTWETNYVQYFNKLDPDAILSVHYLKKSMETTKPDSAGRQKQAIAFAALAEFAELDAKPLRKMKGSYSTRRVGERVLPTDDEIEETMALLQDRKPAWAWVFGTIATYGIRPHEIFYLDWKQFPILKVLHGSKTGERITVPLKPEWAERWQLQEAVWPNFRDKAKTNKLLGQKIHTGFARLGLPYQTYDYRHAWAWRSHEYELSDETAAKFMGHSPDIHRRTYKRWIGDSPYLNEYERAIRKFGD